MATPVLAEDRRIEFESYLDVQRIFEDIGYTEALWDQGLREVPRIYLTNWPSRWRQKTSLEIQVKTKKELFFRVMAPMILTANEVVMKDRHRLLTLREMSTPGTDELSWLGTIAAGYRLELADPPTAADFDTLLSRVDQIPPSLAMAQSVEESGWGTSRFADVGNALFGQWAWGDNAIKPEQQRSDMGNYGIAAFATPQGSIDAYMRNINTHSAYSGLRSRRAALRAEGQAVRGNDLSPTLSSYSERGQHYVESLNAIMRINKLLEIDEAYLAEGPTILLAPVGEGAH